MDISPISKTAILTLICRAVEAERQGAGSYDPARSQDSGAFHDPAGAFHDPGVFHDPAGAFHDPMARLCLERLMGAAAGDDRRWMEREKRIYEGFHARDAKALVTKRVKVFDALTNRFIAEHPGCTVVNLACGFDTRFWRINHEQCRYVEIDLPGVVALKKEILKDQLGYELIGCSALDTAWMDEVTARGNVGFLLLAEGLFMFFPKAEAARLLGAMAEKFQRSQLVLDTVPENYTRGIWKLFMRLETNITWGLDVTWAWGIGRAEELEAFGPGLKVVETAQAATGKIITVEIEGKGEGRRGKEEGGRKKEEG